MGGFLSVVISAMAVWMDLREEAVDNSWVLFSIMAGFLLQLLEKGPKGMIIFLTGAAVPLILLGILFIFRMLGAGDVKILCDLGGIMVPRTGTECIRPRILYLCQYMNEFYCTGEIRPYYRKGMEFPENFHFTVPIFLSALLYAGGVY